MELKELIKLELKHLNIEASDEIVELELEKAKIDICDYCNIVEVPLGLKNTLVNITIGYINSKINGSDDENLKSIQEGDTTLTFNSKESTSKEVVFNNNIKALNKFRTLSF
jgi:hypothetical protein